MWATVVAGACLLAACGGEGGTPTAAPAQAQPGPQVSSFVERSVAVADVDSPRGLAFADLDADGRIDFTLANNGSNSLSIFLQNAGGDFYLARQLTAGTTPVEVCALDVNADGKKDLLSTNHGSGELSLFIGYGDGTFNSAVQIKPIPAFVSYALACGDLDGDGAAEAVSTSFNEALAYVFKFNPANPSAPTYSTLTVGAIPLNVVLADFDKSGTPDLFILNRDSNTASVYKNNGSLSFTLHQTLATGSMPFGGDVVDIGGVFHFALATAVSNTIQIYRLGADGQFAAPLTLPSGGSSTRTLIGFDIDQDQDQDLLVLNASSNETGVFIYDAGGFQPVQLRMPTAISPRLIVKQDINADGVLDYVIVYATGGLRMFLSRPA